MNKKYLYLAMIFACTGFLLSVMLGKIGLSLFEDPGYHSFCNFNESFNCDAVALSSFSSHFGVPNFLYGMLYYIIILLSGAICLLSEGKKLKNYFVYLFWLSLLSLIISFYLFLISIFVIKSKCIMCMMVYGVNIILFVVALMAEKFDLNRMLKALIDDTKLFFSSGLRILLFVVLCTCGTVILSFTNAHPLLSQENSDLNVPVDIKYDVSTADRLVYGPKTVPDITMVMFTDYECQYCGIASKELKKVLKNNPDIRLIFKDYPLDKSCNERISAPFHRHACNASLAARCAAEQGQFWQYHDLLYDNQTQLSDSNLEKYAKSLNLDMQQFNECRSSKKHLNKIITDIDEGVALGVGGTPMVFIEGKEVIGYKTAEEYQTIIEGIKLDRKKELEELQKKKQEYLRKLEEQQELEKKNKSNTPPAKGAH